MVARPDAVVPPQAGETGGVGEDHVGLVLRQHVLGPQLALGGVQQRLLGHLAVLLPALLQLGKELVMGLGGVDELHQPGLGLVDEILLLQHDAKRVANVEENRFDIGGHGNSSFM